MPFTCWGVGVRRLAQVVVAGAALAVAFVAGSPGSAAGDRAAPRGFVAALAAPTPGDVSYGIARVRLVRVLRSPAAAGGLVFGQRVGGLVIVARSSRWRSLRATTRVYVVVSSVVGAGRNVRDVAFVVIRRRTRTAHGTGGAIVFSIENAQPAIGSFWDRGVDRRGYVVIFQVHDMLATAVGNWSRYLSVLRAAHALAAAADPLEVGPVRSTAAAGASSRAGSTTASVWTGGQRPSKRLRAIFRLLRGALSSPLEYAAVKQSRLIFDFIARELGNRSLAKRWQRVTSILPLRVPDRYAAAAQEEARFTKVLATRITRATVAMSTYPNSSSQLGDDVPLPVRTNLDVYRDSTGFGYGSVTGSLRLWVAPSQFVTLGNLNCAQLPDGIGEFSPCGAGIDPAGFPTEELQAVPDTESVLLRWGGCDAVTRQGAGCSVDVQGRKLSVTATFGSNEPIFDNLGTGSGYVSAAPGPGCNNVGCNLHVEPGPVQGWHYGPGRAVTFTATADPGSTFAGWSGCAQSSGADCTIDFPPSVQNVLYAYPRFDSCNGSCGAITLFAGTGSGCASPPSCGDAGSATSAQLTAPYGVAVDAGGNVYIADTADNEVRKIAVDGTITRFAGDGAQCANPPCGDGGRAIDAQLASPTAVAIDRAGNVYIADTADNEVRKVAPNGTITRFAGIGPTSPCTTAPSCGDGDPATAAALNEPFGVAVSAATGNVYIADSGDQEVRVVDPGGIIDRIAGTGAACTTPPNCGDGGPPTSAQLTDPTGVAIDAFGELDIADPGDNEIRQLAGFGIIERIAGTGSPCASAPSCGDGGPAQNASLRDPWGVAADAYGNLYIADTGDEEIRKVAPDGTITRLAGNGTACTTAPECGDGGPPGTARLNGPIGVAAGPAGILYIADEGDDEIRRIG